MAEVLLLALAVVGAVSLTLLATALAGIFTWRWIGNKRSFDYNDLLASTPAGLSRVFLKVYWLLDALPNHLLPPPQRAVDVIVAFMKSELVMALVQLGVFDVLQAQGPCTAPELARHLNITSVDWLKRLLDAGAAIRFVSARETKRRTVPPPNMNANPGDKRSYLGDTDSDSSDSDSSPGRAVEKKLPTNPRTCGGWTGYGFQEVQDAAADAVARVFAAGTRKTNGETGKAEGETVKADGGTVKADGETIEAGSVTVKSDAAEVKPDGDVVKSVAAKVKADGDIVKSDVAKVNLDGETIRSDAENVKPNGEAIQSDSVTSDSSDSSVKPDAETVRPDEGGFKLDAGGDDSCSSSTVSGKESGHSATEMEYSLTSLSSTLCANHPNSLRAFALMAKEQIRPYDYLVKGVQAHKTPFELYKGHSFWKECELHPDVAQRFDAGMIAVSSMINAEALVRDYPWKRFDHVVDVGGGLGGSMVPMLKRHPPLTGTLFDLPHVIESSRKVWSSKYPDLLPRIQLASGSFLDPIPAGHPSPIPSPDPSRARPTAYLLRNILHDWNDEDCVKILSCVRNAIGTGPRAAESAVLAIAESAFIKGHYELLVPRRLSDVHMMVMLGGKERTEEEFEWLLKQAGFELRRVYNTRGLFVVLEAIPV